MSRRDREKAARASATAARPGKASKLQAILDAWDAWEPDNWSNQEKWIQGCNAVEAAIEAARTDVPNARTEANWLVEGLKDAAREEYIGATHIMLHALEAARAEIRGGL